MAKHSLSPGKRWIANLLELGLALGYDVDDEFNVAQPGDEEAPVDVVWLRSAEDHFPLFIFEVETRPSGQMTYNAGKVFGQDTDLFEKPLFHFHVVLTGGETSGRLKAATGLFGRFNYRVYRAATPHDATNALCDMLSQHRRVTEALSVTALAGALDPQHWTEIDLDVLWGHVERCRFTGAFERDYARLSAADETFLPRLVRRLRFELDGEGIDPSQYESPLARHCAPLLHAAIVGLMDPALAPDALALATDWQGNGAEARVRPPDQQSELQENFAYSYAPALWAAIAAALATEDARSWALAQLELVLGGPGRPTPLAMSACAAAWMLQVARSGGEPHRGAYERAASHLQMLGGIASELLECPPATGGMMDAIDAWEARLQRDPVAPPDWDSLTGDHQPSAGAEDPLLPTLVSILADPAAELDARAILQALWGSHGR